MSFLPFRRDRSSSYCRQLPLTPNPFPMPYRKQSEESETLGDGDAFLTAHSVYGKEKAYLLLKGLRLERFRGFVNVFLGHCASAVGSPTNLPDKS